MSLSQPIVHALEKSIDTFIQRISQKHGIDKTLLMKEWNSEQVVVSNMAVSNTAVSNTAVDLGDMLNANKADLAQMCKDRGIPCSGTKEVLRSRLLNQEKNAPIVSKPVVTKPIKQPPMVLLKIQNNQPLIVPKKSEFGNTVHEESRLVFNTGTGKIVGRENDQGVVLDLLAADIDECNRYGLKYDLPENLDKTVGLVDVHVDGMEDDESESESEEEYDEIIEEELLEEELLEEFGGDESEEEYEEEYEEEEDEE